ncbi:MAG: hypothetical protein LBB89_08700 [Treponema sp.]|jgi:hypothetical protein|nr:hypothetical protein [Treponema sp.]
MRKMLFILVFFVNALVYTQETDKNIDDEYYDSGMAGNITIYGERSKEYDSESMDAYVLKQLNGSSSDRRQFIETDFLEKAGFRRTGNVKYRKSETSEKLLSVLHGVSHLFSFGIVPMKPFFEIEYDELPKGKYYQFESVIIKNNFINATPEILIVIELEYKLQIEFCNGIIIQNNTDYYTDENIDKFEKLISKLPDYPESIKQIKNRYSGELLKIKAAFERHKNPSENYLRALQNVGNSFKNLRR